MKEFKQLLKLAAIKVSPEESKLLEQDIQGVISYFARLNELEEELKALESGEETNQQMSFLREDIAQPYANLKAIRQNFPESSGEYLTSPPVSGEG